jgi:prepilin-type N-terminal cleavage/methylation domain-containing protein
MSARSRSGFTLIEILVAMVVSGMIVAAAAGLLSVFGDRAQTIDRAGMQADREGNAYRLLQQIVGNAATTADSTPGVVGNASGASFQTWCESPHGWLDHCAAQLRFERTGDGVALLMRLRLRSADSAVVDIRRSLGIGRLRYLRNAESRGTWTDSWAMLGPPEAVAVILDADTLLLPVWSGE